MSILPMLSAETGGFFKKRWHWVFLNSLRFELIYISSQVDFGRTYV